MAGRNTGNHRLFGLPSTTMEYEYQGQQHLLNIVERTMETCSRETHVIFSHLDPETYERDIEAANDWRIDKSFDTYLPDPGLLLLEMPTSTIHEATSRGFYDVMMEAMPRRLRRTLRKTGTAERSSTTRRKCPDVSWIPKELPPGRSTQWPTMVVECGWSETRAKLERDCRWWLHESQGDVRIALSISVHTRRKQIIMQKWESSQLQGQTSERVTQNIVLTQTRNHPIRVVGAPLRLEFEKVFLRQPVANRGEGDVEITAHKLRSLAQEIWEVHPNL